MQAAPTSSMPSSCTIVYLAGEAFWVPLGIEGSDEALHDGFVTALATRGIVVIVTLPAECLAVLLMETVCSKLLAT